MDLAVAGHRVHARTQGAITFARVHRRNRAECAIGTGGAPRRFHMNKTIKSTDLAPVTGGFNRANFREATYPERFARNYSEYRKLGLGRWDSLSGALDDPMIPMFVPRW